MIRTLSSILAWATQVTGRDVQLVLRSTFLGAAWPADQVAAFKLPSPSQERANVKARLEAEERRREELDALKGPMRVTSSGIQ